MPHQARPAAADDLSSSVTSYGQVIEYIAGTASPRRDPPRAPNQPSADMYILNYTDRLYLASYTYPPDENTPFPYPPSKPAKSPSKRSARAQHGPQAVEVEPQRPQPVYFSIDHTLLYNAFHADFGPLHVGHLYRFAVQLHDVLGHPNNENRAVVFWSNPDSRSAYCFQEGS